MPIRFRCTHCNQLMGIARRKAGSMVRCPSCHREVAVPEVTEDDPSPPPVLPPVSAFAPVPPAQAPTPPPANPAAPASNLFDRDDFDALLRGSISSDHAHAVGRPATAPPPPPLTPDRAAVAGAGLSPGVSSGPRPGRAGVALSPRFVTMLSVVVILLLAAAFALGLVVGRSVP